MFFQTGIMSGRNPIAIKTICPFRQYTKLEKRVTHHTWIGCTPLPVLIYEILNNGIFKRGALVCHKMLDTHTYRQLRGIMRFVSPYPHGDTHNLISFFHQHQASSGAIYSATHTHQHSFTPFSHPKSNCIRAKVRDIQLIT